MKPMDSQVPTGVAHASAGSAAQLADPGVLSAADWRWLDRTLLRNLLQAAARSVMGAIAGSTALMAMLLLAPGGSEGTYPWFVGLWWGLLLVGQLGGLALAVWYQRAGIDDASLDRMGHTLVAVQAYVGALWGAASWLLLPAPSLTTQAFLLIVVAVVMAGASGMVSTVRLACRAFIWCMALPLAAGVARVGDIHHLVMGAGFLLLAAIVQKNCADQERAVREAVAAQLRTSRALEALAAQQQATERARLLAEEAWRETEAANRAKTAFLAAAGHDLRQPMHALVQYFSHVRRLNDNPALSHALAMAGMALGSMQALLDAVLEMSKLLMGGLQPQLEVVNLVTLLRQTQAQLEPLAQSRGLTLTLELPNDAAPALTDPVLLQRVLMNLGTNAVRYSAEGAVRLRLKEVQQVWQLSVADTGQGMRREDQERVFEPFVQLHNPERESTKGLGLGLAIVRQLCLLLDIDLRLRSSWQRGTVFRLQLGRTQQAPKPEDTTTHRQRDILQGVRVLLIDDNAMSLEATGLTLRGLGCTVLAATNSADAKTQRFENDLPPDLIVSDYRLVAETGPEAVEAVRASEVERVGDDFVIPALIVSGDTAPDELLRVQEAGMPMLHKPVSPEALRGALEDLLLGLAAGPTVTGSPSEAHV
jgi:signal transduction histidine kinase